MTIIGLFTAPLQDLYGLLDARIEQLREQGDTSETEAPKPTAAEPSGSEPQGESATASGEPAPEGETTPNEGGSGAHPQGADTRETSAETPEPETQTEEEDQ